MKKIIEESGLKLKEFAELYNIPYNTVRQWYNDERKCPEYIKSLILQIRELKSKGKQLNITTGKIFNILETKVGMFSIYSMFEENDKDFEKNIEYYSSINKVIKTYRMQEII